MRAGAAQNTHARPRLDDWKANNRKLGGSIEVAHSQFEFENDC
jgi:hypothetical protein